MLAVRRWFGAQNNLWQSGVRDSSKNSILPQWFQPTLENCIGRFVPAAARMPSVDESLEGVGAKSRPVFVQRAIQIT